MPAGLIYDDYFCYGMRESHPGLFEIKFHNPPTKNSIMGNGY